MITDTLSISNEFNKFFKIIGKNISESLPVPVNTNPKRCLNLLSTGESFYFFLTTADEILKYINQLDHKKAAGMDGLPVKCIKMAGDIISPLPCMIFSIHIINGTFLSSLKVAKKTPLYKAEPHTMATYCCPISVLFPSARVFQKIIYFMLNSFFIWNN